MPAWFDISSLAWHVDPNGPEDEVGIENSSAVIDDLIENEIKEGINSSRIILGGSSQGGALALYTTLTKKRQLGGLIILSSWLPLRNKLPGSVIALNTDTPCFKHMAILTKLFPIHWAS